MSTDAVLTRPHVGRMLCASLLGRLPVGMMPLALVLFVRDDGGSYTLAGLVTAAYALGSCVGGPTISRWMDASGQRRPLVVSGVLSTVSIALLPVVHAELVVPLTLLAGLASPPLEPALRALWPGLVDRARLPSAYAIDAAAQELVFVLGPLVVLGATSMSTAGGLLAAALVTITGVGWFVTGAPSREWRAPQRVSRHWLGPLRARRLVVLYAALAALGLTVGTLAVAFVAYAESVGTRGLGSWLVALNALGALLGGVVYSRLRRHPVPDGAIGPFLLALALTYLPLAAVPAPAFMTWFAVLSGLFLPPALTCAFQLVDRWAPPGTTTEAFAWIVSAFLVGSSIGAATAGSLVAQGRLSAPYLLAAGAAAGAAVGATLAARAPGRR